MSLDTKDEGKVDKETIVKNYQKIISKDFEPYKYQIAVSELLLNNHNVILSVPTGAGKTWASIMPFIIAQKSKNIHFPSKLIYTLPLRTLTNSIYKTIKPLVDASIQTGEYSEDEYLEKDIVFATIDQVLSSFLCFPLPLSESLANINAGALIGSYIIFDEFHLLDSKLSMATSLGMLKILGSLSRFCIMTATLSNNFIQFIKDNFKCKVVTLNDFPEDRAKISSLIPSQDETVKKKIVVSDSTINADTIIKNHKNRTIVICNRVETVQKIFNDLEKQIKNLNIKPQLICIHSRFFNVDRKEKEQKIIELFNKDSQANAILISTQVIEAGMDISCEVMHTEISPINSFLQRIGRCARFALESGKIFIYDVLDIEEKEQLKFNEEDELDKQEIRALNNKYLPYNSDLCKQTFSKLKEQFYIDEQVAEQLVNEILSEEENKITDLLKEKNYNKEKIKVSWSECKKNLYRTTIRDIQSVEIAIIDIQSNLGKPFNPFQFETVSIYKWSFIKKAKELLSDPDDFDGDPKISIAEQSHESSFDDDWKYADAYFLKEVGNIDNLKNHYGIIFVDKQYFGYSKDIGFFFEKGETVSPFKQGKEKNKKDIVFKKDTFYQHNMAIINCFKRNFLSKQDFIFKELENLLNECGISFNDFESIIKIMIVFHDYGKLNNKWQKPMQEYQRLKAESDPNFLYDPSEVLAHSDYDDLVDKDIALKAGMNKRPGHAGIGGYVVSLLLEDLYDEEVLANCVANAISKHHNSKAESFPEFNTQIYVHGIENILNSLNLKMKPLMKRKQGSLIDAFPENDLEWLLYLYLVRILRLCDQKATADMEEYYKGKTQ